MLTAFFSNIEKVIIANLSKATSSVKIAVAWLTNPKIFVVIENLYEKDIKLQIVVSDDKINFVIAKNYFKSLLNKKVEIRVTSFPHLMHHKFCIIDNRLLVTGSYNWTKGAEINNHENIILTNEKLLVDKYITAYSDLLKVAKRLTSFEIQHFENYTSSIVEQIELQLEKQEQSETSNNYTLTGDEISVEHPEETLDLLDRADIHYLAAQHDMAIEICNQILQKYPNTAEAYEIISLCKWRQGKYHEQIKYAQKAIDLDNQLYSAYNSLGIGFSHISNAQKSIDNYEICISAESDNYLYYRNRALSYIDLENDSAVPKKMRDQFAAKANKDFQAIIALTNKAERSDKSYGLYYSRGIAKLYVDKPYTAKQDFLVAKEVYESTPKPTRCT